jgi:hypothetical protein
MESTCLLLKKTVAQQGLKHTIFITLSYPVELMVVKHSIMH